MLADTAQIEVHGFVGSQVDVKQPATESDLNQISIRVPKKYQARDGKLPKTNEEQRFSQGLKMLGLWCIGAVLFIYAFKKRAKNE